MKCDKRAGPSSLRYIKSHLFACADEFLFESLLAHTREKRDLAKSSCACLSGGQKIGPRWILVPLDAKFRSGVEGKAAQTSAPLHNRRAQLRAAIGDYVPKPHRHLIMWIVSRHALPSAAKSLHLGATHARATNLSTA